MGSCAIIIVQRSVYTQILQVRNALEPQPSNNKYAKFSGSMSSKTDTLLSTKSKTLSRSMFDFIGINYRFRARNCGELQSKYFVLSLKRRTYRACPMCKASLLYLDEQMREFNNRKNENLSEMAIDNGR